MLELKSALEEELATRLGMDRVPAHDELVSKVRASGILDETNARLLSALLSNLSQVESRLAIPRRGLYDRIRDADVFQLAARVQELLAAAERRPKPS
jgi:hypothetical protein